MGAKLSIIALALVVGVHQASAQQPHAPVQIIAQAYDRCMATSGVRLTKTAATDEDIYTQAIQSCLSLKRELAAAVDAQMPPKEAAGLLQAVDAQSKPAFLAMVAHIRRDREMRERGASR
jgi:hypothetical protein